MTRRRPQLRTRVLAGVLLVTLVTLVAFDVAAVTGLRKYLLDQTDTQMRAVLHLYQPLATTPASYRIAVHLPAVARVTRNPRRRRKLPFRGPVLRMAPAVLDQYYLEFIRNRHAHQVLVSGNADLRPQANWISLNTASRPFQTVPSATSRTQLRMQTLAIAGGVIVVTTSLASVNHTVDQLKLILAFGSVVAGLLVALGVAFVVRRGLRPIETMAGQADRITAGGLADRVTPDDSSTEVGRLGAALNGMLGRIESSIHEREASQELTRRFFADASHELRNPLASLRANAELYQQGALTERGQVDEAMRRIALEAQRMSGLVDDMLRLARLDQHPDPDCDPVDLSELLASCAERAEATDQGRIWLTEIQPGLRTTGDQELLRRAVDNLVANVRTHTPEGTTALIAAARENGTVRIAVSDDGPGVPSEQLPHIFDRFYRGAGPGRPGSGLGLAIVTAIASAHDGAAQAEPNGQRGLRVTLTLPASELPAATKHGYGTMRTVCDSV